MRGFPKCTHKECFANRGQGGYCVALMCAEEPCKFYKADYDGRIRAKIEEDIAQYKEKVAAHG